MPISLSHRDKETGQIVTVPYTPPDNGVVSPAAAAPDGTASGTLADAPGPRGQESAEGSAPQASPEAPAPSVAGGQGAEGEDDADLDETATAPSPEDYARAKKRINQLTGRFRAEQKRRVDAEQQWTQREAYWQGQLEAQARLLQGAMPETPQPPSGPPQAEQFQSHDDYVRATARYEAQQVQQGQAQQQQVDAQQRALLEREQAFRAQHADFDERIRTGLAGQVAPHVQQALMLLPEGPALAYALATQPETLRRLNTLAPPLMLMELGRLLPDTGTRGHGDTATGDPSLAASPRLPVAASPQSQPPPPPAPATPTPPVPLPEPLRPVGGMATSAPAGFDPATATQAEFRAKWNAGWRPSPADFQRR